MNLPMPEGADMKRLVAPGQSRSLFVPPRQVRSSSVLRIVALIAMVMSLTAVAVFTPLLIDLRQQAVEAERDALIVHHLVDEATLAATRLELELEHADTAAFRDQVATLARLNIRHPVEAEAEVPELRDLRALIDVALPRLEAMAALDAPDVSLRLHEVLRGLYAGLEKLAQSSDAGIDRRILARQGTGYALPLVNLFMVCMILAALLFLGAMLYRDHALRRAHRDLAAWGREMAALTSAMPGVLVRSRKRADGRWTRTFVANSVVALTGFSVEDAMASGWLRRNIEPPVAPLVEAMEHALAGAEQVVVVQFRRRDGRWIWLRMLMKAHEARDGEGEVLSTWSDVTREYDLAQRAEHSARLAQLGEVATSMAHELNQPLSGISLAAENAQRMLLRWPDAPPRLAAKLDVIVSLAMRAAGIIDRMRVFGRAAESENEPVRMEQILDSALGTLHGRMEQSGVNILRDLPPGLPPAHGKPVPLALALTNLVVNACDAYDEMAAPPPPGERWVQVAARVEGDRLRVTVRDRAGGVPPAIMPKIFEPFFTTRVAGRSPGLGLSVSHGILADMGGTLSAAPLEGGTEFAIVLRLAAPDVTVSGNRPSAET
ncbi:sensor histidine kinase [Falsiroseomonas sp. HC035]|uniref:sensor histidine kinase n=1 Tax=Falsiroseomonas sp. HC035 TaxID=3390999 RepID=UPI003D30FD47